MIPLAQALICLEPDCETISAEYPCPRCGSREMWPLAKWIKSVKGPKRELAQLSLLRAYGHPDRRGIEQAIEDWTAFEEAVKGESQ